MSSFDRALWELASAIDYPGFFTATCREWNRLLEDEAMKERRKIVIFGYV